MRKAKIIKYYQVVDEQGILINTAHTYKQAVKMKRDYDAEKSI